MISDESFGGSCVRHAVLRERSLKRSYLPTSIVLGEFGEATSPAIDVIGQQVGTDRKAVRALPPLMQGTLMLRGS